MICRCCGSPKLRYACLNVDDSRRRYLRCVECESMNLGVSYAEVVAAYHTEEYARHFNDYAGGAERLIANYHEHVHGLRQVLPDGGRVLDVGCGGGGFLAAAQRRGWEAWGFDVTERSRATAQGLAGLPPERVVIAPEFSAGDFPVQFQAVHCSDVIEHVESPRRLLEEMRAALRPEGWLFLQTPTCDGGMAAIWNQDVHLCIMPETSLRCLLYETGFDVHEPLFKTWLRSWSRPGRPTQPAGGQCYFCRKR